MSVIFLPQNHEYISSDQDKIDWMSITSFLSNFKKPFEADPIAIKSSKNKKSKWYGMTPEDIKAAWKAEANRATSLGTWYHNCRERDLCDLTTIEREGITVPVVKPVVLDGIKHAPEQKLTEGIYPEHMVYLKSAGLCGQSDLVEVVNGKLSILDYKTNKEIKTEGFTNWEGITQKMLAPVSHLDDCNFNHYALQLSLYMYIILKHNPQLKPGNLTIHHILFEDVDKDKFGNPITALDSNGDPIVKDIVQYDIPYLKSEVITLMNWLKENRTKIKPKK